MNEDFLVKLEKVSKKFCRDLKRSLWYGVQDLTKELIGLNSSHNLRSKEFWAIQNISFELGHGEVVGIIGPNGAGKTTLLRLINLLVKPDRGKITVRGRVGALIALGAGFNPILTGRENIYINAAVLGLPKQKVNKILDEIIDFAQIEEFIDTPLQSYSTGMRARLGFAVAAYLDPDVLLVDEVLSVGDYAFREKSFDRMSRICNSGAGVVFISHNVAAILTICHRVIWIERGKIHMHGPTEDVVKAYMESQEEKANLQIQKETERTIKADNNVLYDQLRITKIELLNQQGIVTTKFWRSDNLHVRIHYVTSLPIPEPHFIVHVGTQREVLLVADMLVDRIAPPMLEDEGFVECVFYDLPLLPNRYIIKVFVLGETPIIKIVFPPKQAFFTVTTNSGASQQNAISITRSSGTFPIQSKWNW